ncbi:MAG: Asp-tRNA(Asn)/Glu-tRNA(Gln) amidotransferase subunit GatB [bacterium]|nr:Asp-tRNA(Asn)/Glu-tRNA(Gln) amidotransferase subunit GatB [bacterium]MDT8366283.1 Asp-tRNA(Asn)/Glu-tRNA(Gln) amidotransferase subunit GatB [bacterium]
MKYIPVMGLEVHAQLKTNSKIFCGCSTLFGAEPNTHTCPVCLGMPGVLPVLNRKVVDFTIMMGLATNCRIATESIFARKNYFYPDLPKGYQVSQFEAPICEGGWVDITVDGKTKRIGITRIHMEEDAGKLVHVGALDSSRASFVDLNRACVPLMEIVSEPDIRSPEEARAYMQAIRDIVVYLGVCDGNLEEGSLRCDANISVMPEGSDTFGTRAEIKNMNSFRFLQQALEYEIDRQIDLIESGGQVIQETRLFDSDKGVTVSMRGKEEAHDYRYFPEPDLVPIRTDDAWIDRIREQLPELRSEKLQRYVGEMGIPEYDAEVITADSATALFFEETVAAGADPKKASNWVMGEFARMVKDKGHEVAKITPMQLAEIIGLVDGGTISGSAAKQVFEEVFDSGRDPMAVVEEKGLAQVSDAGAIEEEVQKILDANPDQVQQYKDGNDKVLGFFVGQVMKASKGKANPKVVNEMLRKLLKN